MIYRQIVRFLCVFLIVVQCQSVFANESQTNFTRYMLEWREKSEIAQDYLRSAEFELKSGLRSKACLNQRLASRYGVEAFEALIMAQQYNEYDKELLNIEVNLNQWRKLGYCSTAGSLFD